MYTGFNLKYFKTVEKLTKSYIIEKMVGHEEYGFYVPNGISPERLTREFLLAVSFSLYNFIS